MHAAFSYLYQVTFGNDHGTVAPDHHDDALAGDIRLPDLMTAPGMMLHQHGFLQIDRLIIFQRGTHNTKRNNP